MGSSSQSDRDILLETVKPINYALSIFDIELGGSWSYHGTVDITAKIMKDTKSITLNSHQLKLHSSEVVIEKLKSKHTIVASDVSYDVPTQRATITFSEEIPAAENVVISIKFQGTANNDMCGFYRSMYKPAATPAPSVAKDGEFHYMFSTQFESSDARRAFPCFDEPNLKATFDVEIELPEDQVALSNMPVKSARGGKKGLQIVTFDRTPIMSTYLLAWAVGDFEYVEEFTKRQYGGKHLPVRVYTTRGLKEEGRFALEHAHKIVDYFSEIFQIDYMLPKADLLAVHEFSHGAMENWGLITYRVSTVLWNEHTSSAKYKNRVAYVVAHELAHQWFGNLVTMDWWSELWLNEGFATWVGWLATDYLHPDWNIWPQFVSEGMQGAFTLDSLRTSHPIEVPVRDALDVDQIFDHISYLKGSSVIRMLAAHLGLKVFLQGVSEYLKAHAYGNATTSDLWSALSHASGQDVNALMDPWIRKIGYPMLGVTEKLGQVGVKQTRYLSTGDLNIEDDETVWWIPLGLKVKTGTQGVIVSSLTAKEDTIRGINDGFYKINVDNTGFFRTNYPPARLADFGKQLGQLSISDKIGLIGDAGALAYSGDATTQALLGFLENFSLEENQLVWSQITSSLSTIKSVFSEVSPVSGALKLFTLKLIDSAVGKIGWDFDPSEDYLTGQLRALLIITAGMNGNESIITEAQRRFHLYMGGDSNAIHPNLRLAVFKMAVRYGGKEEYESVKEEWTKTSTIDGKEIALLAMGQIQSVHDLLPDFLSFVFTKVNSQDAHTIAAALAANPKTRLGLWEHIKANWVMVKEKLGGNMVVLDRFLKMGLDKFADLDVEKDIADFFKGKDNRGYDRTLGIVSDTIKGRAAYKEREKEILLQWLKDHQYAS